MRRFSASGRDRAKGRKHGACRQASLAREVATKEALRRPASPDLTFLCLRSATLPPSWPRGPARRAASQHWAAGRRRGNR
jgi:hypothetical protein